MQGFVATPTPGDFIPRMMKIPFYVLFLPKRFTSRGQFIFKSLGALCSGVM